VALATAANVGSVATLTGNPQNMLVGSFSGIPYRTFLLYEAPVALLGLGIVLAVVWWVHRPALREAAFDAAELRTRFPVHYPLMTKTVLAVAAMLVAFLVGVPVALVAIAGAAATLLTRRVKPAKVYREINWELFVLFTGLFVLIGGIEAAGLTRELFRGASAVRLDDPGVLTVASAVVSNLVSNVPAVLLFKTVIPTFAEPARAWLVLAMSSTLAGNLTIVGSVANLIVVEAARSQRVEIGLAAYCRVGIPVTLATLLVGWLILRLVPV
jgi:Na+/H+ antiporter NhaD/arsenite permease-like protein